MLDWEWKIICELCWKSFNKVIAHIWQKHKLSWKQYRVMFWLSMRWWLMSQQSYQLAKDNNEANYDEVVVNNLLNKGSNTRFKNWWNLIIK